VQFPKEVLGIVRKANLNHPSYPTEATAEALKGVKRLSSFEELVDTLIEHAVHDLVCDDRHSINTSIKRQSGVYYQTPKTVVGNSDAVMRAAFSVYSYRIAGTSLGEVLGKDLIDIAVNQDNKADGHVFNSMLMRRLSSIVPDKQKVKNAITQKKLKALFAELMVTLKDKKDSEAA